MRIELVPPTGVVISGTQAGSGRYHYLDQVLKPAEPRVASRYVESAMSGRFVLSAGAHRRPRQWRFPANCHCYVKDKSLRAFTNDSPNSERCIQLEGVLERAHAATLYRLHITLNRRYMETT